MIMSKLSTIIVLPYMCDWASKSGPYGHKNLTIFQLCCFIPNGVCVKAIKRNFLLLINNATFYSLQKATTLCRTENIQYCVISCTCFVTTWSFLLTWSHTHNEGNSCYQFKS